MPGSVWTAVNNAGAFDCKATEVISATSTAPWSPTNLKRIVRGLPGVDSIPTQVALPSSASSEGPSSSAVADTERPPPSISSTSSEPGCVL